MKELIRIDKLLSDMGFGTRSEVKKYLKYGFVTINDMKINKPEYKVNTTSDIIKFKDEVVNYNKYEYYMLNKPSGVISATEDLKHTTVIDLLKNVNTKNLFPVGRLDIDTEGLLLITNDGELSHRLLSPKKHISKIYFARIDGKVDSQDAKEFEAGVKLDDDYITKPAQLKILNSDDISEIELTIYEGKFHQVKRMFEAVGKKVIYLKRLSMGSLQLDDNLKLGQYRKLTDEEISMLRSVREQIL